MELESQQVVTLGWYWPFLALMLLCACGSAFFSLSEAALFSLDERGREEIAGHSRQGQRVSKVLARSEELLAAILLGNLVCNLVYFASSAIISLSLQSQGMPRMAAMVGIGSLAGLIIFCEMLPKTLGVSRPRFWAVVVAGPMNRALKLTEGIMPCLRTLSSLTLRVIWPRFKPEPYLQVGDLERAVEWSIVNRLLLSEEEAVLQGLVALAEIRADELMRPRKQVPLLRPPVFWRDLQGVSLRGGYVYISDPETDDPAAALPLREICRPLEEPLEQWAQPLAYVPWCISAADVLETLWKERRLAAAVVNEYGETLGVITFEDLLRIAFSLGMGAADRPLEREPIRYLGGSRWQVTGSTVIRRLVKHFKIASPPTRCVTVGGLFQECLGRFPTVGDECSAGPLRLRVLDISSDGDLLVELQLVADKEKSEK